MARTDKHDRLYRIIALGIVVVFVVLCRNKSVFTQNGIPNAYNCFRNANTCSTAIVQLPGSIPNVGNLTGAGTVVTPTDFSNPIVRVTDKTTRPDRSNSGAGTSWGAAESGSADENMFNTDDSLILVSETAGGNYKPLSFSFDGVNASISGLYLSNFPTTNGMIFDANDSQWSRVNNQILYRFEANTKLVKYDFTNRSTPPTAQTVFDFHASSSNCLPTGINWNAIGGVGYQDGSFGGAFGTGGGQDNPGDIYLAMYKPGQGCRMLNTSTGAVIGDYGPTGTITGLGSPPCQFYMHNAKSSLDGNYLIAVYNNTTGGTCSGVTGKPVFWQVDTLNAFVPFTSCGDCPGHWAGMYSTFTFENANSPPNIENRLLSAITSMGTVINPSSPSGFATPWDQHMSPNNLTTGDNTPVCTSSFNPNGAPAMYTFAWAEEVLCFSTNGSITTAYRVAHTFNTDKSSRFITSQAIGAMSQSGNFFMWSSDWMGTLGSEGNSSSCTIGGPNLSTGCRGDTFIAKLPVFGTLGVPRGALPIGLVLFVIACLI